MTTARDQLYFDLFVTAIEGGINYWADIVEYRPNLPGTNDDNVTSFHAEVFDDGDDGATFDVNRATISRGYRLATSGEWAHLHWSTERPPMFVNEDTDWDFDAGDADTIVQLGLGLIDTMRDGTKCVRYG